MAHRSRPRVSHPFVFAIVVALMVAAPGRAQERAAPPPLQVTLVLTPGLDEEGRPLAAAIAGVEGFDPTAERTVKVEMQAAAWPAGPSRPEKPLATNKSSVELSIGGPSPALEIFSRVPLPPGAYEIEVTVKAAGRTGTARGAVDVPDFARERLAATDLVLHAEPAVPSGPGEELADVLPAPPTGARTFASTDKLTAIVRLHEGGSGAPEVVHLVAHLVNQAKQGLATELGRIDPSAFGPDRIADYRFEIPLERMRPGEYALSIEFSAGGAVVTRDVHFTVR